MMRAYNFNAGPSALPLEVLQIAQQELVNFQGTGMSVMELSHRSKEYDAVHEKAKTLLKQLLNISDEYEVLFLQGGASLQFTMIPMNLLSKNTVANYVLTGSWSEKALAEAKKIGHVHVSASSKENQYKHIPSINDLEISDNAAYLHVTSNNTIYGTQWSEYPQLNNVELIADMSSDILSHEINVEQFSMIYAGAQKNLGPSGVTVVILKKELLTNSTNELPTMLNYRTHADKNSLYNTPPTFAIYTLSLVLEWLANSGGVKGIERVNNEKASLLYSCIDDSNGFYKPHAKMDSRSKMNVTFTLPSEELTKKFLVEAKEKGFIGLSGHRSVGGCRASIYNAVPLEACETLAYFMNDFYKRNQL
ncbi:3-phosphoserine/phosphohydroxythreonine transaminase [Bacillus sp. SM2101]|uniref:3-phosphoserine/phosphohydroxythreonine transaminase n=1 Tax=Bacillus sp. SM2101 TaxID=2805366 RepID=UPI001BDE39A0